MLSAVTWVKQGAARAEPFKNDPYFNDENDTSVLPSDHPEDDAWSTNTSQVSSADDDDDNEDAPVPSSSSTNKFEKNGKSVMSKKFKWIQDQLLQEKELLTRKLNDHSSANPDEPSSANNMITDDQDFIKKYNLDNYDDPTDTMERQSNINNDSAKAGKRHILDRLFTDLNDLNMNSSDESSSTDTENDHSISQSDKNAPRPDYDLMPLSDDNSDFEEAEEKEDITILPTDHLLVAARMPEEDGIPQLEFYVYEEDQNNLYVHHDILLPSPPLCLEWIGHHVSPINNTASDSFSGSNFVAVGTMDPQIEIWNLDILEPILPIIVLGSTSRSKGNKNVHQDAVLSISWNVLQPNLLASSSADKSIRVWDLNTAPTTKNYITSSVQSFTNHKDKVQSVQWNPQHVSVLASASYDRSMHCIDTRSNSLKDILFGQLKGESETLHWNPFQTFQVAVSDDSGFVSYFDLRKMNTIGKSGETALWSLEAHSKATTVLDFHPLVPSLLLTASLDKSFKLWDLGSIDNESTFKDKPICIYEESFPGAVGKIFGGTFSQSHPCMIAFTGKSNAAPHIWKLSSTSSTLDKSALPEENANRITSLLRLKDWIEKRI